MNSDAAFVSSLIELIIVLCLFGWVVSAVNRAAATLTNEIRAAVKQITASDPAKLSNIAGILNGVNSTNNLLRERIAAPEKKETASGVAPALALYFYSDARAQSQGPFTTAEIKRLASEGRIHSDTPIASAGSDEWMPLCQVAELA